MDWYEKCYFCMYRGQCESPCGDDGAVEARLEE